MGISKRTPSQVLGKDLGAIDSILNSIEKSGRFSSFDSLYDFERNEMAFDACVRQVEIIGEAVKRLSHGVMEMHPEIDWSGLAKMRDKLIHQYDRIDSMILWDTLKKELPLEVPKLLAIKEELTTKKSILDASTKGKTPTLFSSFPAETGTR